MKRRSWFSPTRGRAFAWGIALCLALACGTVRTAQSQGTSLAPPEGEFVLCAEHPPSPLSQWRCWVPGATGVCANRNEYVCVRAPCPQPWYDRCSAYTACRDERVTGYVVGACVTAEPPGSLPPRRSR